MNISKLFKTDTDRAVSPVIGVILMVAITVILAAVIGAFVIGIGEDQEVQPTASFSFDFSSAGDVDEDEFANVVISHSQGDTIRSPDSLFVVIDGERAEWDGEFDTPSDPADDEIYYEFAADSDGSYDVSSGGQVTVDKKSGDEDSTPDWSGESVSVVWESETGDSSATLSSQDAPN